MEWAALITWVMAALFGFTMLAIWLKHGGIRQRGVSKIRPGLLFSHFPLAAAGLVLWIVYLANDEDALAWKAVAILVVVAVLGWMMFLGWPRGRPGSGAQAGGMPPMEPPEQKFPVPVVALHGVFAVTTVVLVFLTAIGVGD
jgi:cytochrome bd-type quinol oxidase subunit 2